MNAPLTFVLASLWMAPLWGQGLPTAGLPTHVSLAEQGKEEDSPDEKKVAEWVVEISNLPIETRNEYTSSFAAAKKAYFQNEFPTCESYLVTCSLICDKNPNVWSLLASSYIAQKRFDEALPLLERVKAQHPEDNVTRLNLSLLYLGKHDFDACLRVTDELLEELRYDKDMLPLRHNLIHRKILCCLMLGKDGEARALLSGISPLDDSPLYYYGQAALSLSQGKPEEAVQSMKTADRIYSSVPILRSYKQNLSFSGLMEGRDREGKKP